MTLALVTPAAAAGHDIFVLHARPLREGATLEHSPRFTEDLWCLTAAVPQQHQNALTLNFDVLPAHYRQVTKELCYAMLSGPLPPAERRLSISTVHRSLNELKRFYVWLQARKPGRALAGLTEADLHDYQLHLLVTVANTQVRHDARRAVRLLWRYRDNLSTDRLPFDPRHIDGWSEPAASGPAENATDRIPEPVLGPLITWALRFVDDFAPDVLAANQRWCELHDHSRRNPPGINTGIRHKLERLLDGHRERGEPLPGRKDQPNMNFLACLLGCHVTTLGRYRTEIDAAAEELGIAAYSAFDIPITGTVDGRPWTEGIVSDHQVPHGLAHLSRLLQIACYVLIAYLSGARDSEIKHLRRGCLRTERDTRDTAYRWKITSLAFKGERDPNGVEATWVIGHPAARAISVLEQLQPPETDLLFAGLLNGSGVGSVSRGSNGALSNPTTNDTLNDFVTWINNYCTDHSRNDGIPQINGKDWRLISRQFRRTLAWFIARRPGGAVAGAIAYRHQAIQMFEGYAGTSDSGFRAEVESEQALARGEHLLAMIDQHEHKTLAGPAGEEAQRRLEQFGEQARFAGSVITDQHRLKRLMRRDDPAIYPDTYLTCVFNPDKALCLKHRGHQDRPQPSLSNCRPLDCHNVALTTDNTTAWRAEITTIDQQLTSKPPLPPLLADRLRARRTTITDFLARYDLEQR
jgi:integrase